MFIRPYVHDAETEILGWSNRDSFKARDAFEGTICFGASGSGKTSGSGNMLARAFLASGWGGLVLCAKPGEADAWRQLCRQTGRESSLIVFSEHSGHHFNFMQYEIERSPGGGATIMNLVALLATVIDAANGRVGQGGSESQFWQKAMKEALMHALSVLWCAYGRVNLFDLFALLQSRPMTPDQAANPAWHNQSFMAQTLIKAEQSPVHPMAPLDYRAAFKYLTVTLANPDSRTTGNLLATISADLAPLMQGTMRKLFCQGTTILPEMTHEGAIIVLDFPLKTYAEAGALAQHIFKLLWQKSVERREVRKRTRPVFLFMDEMQLFLSAYDAEFQSTARSSRCATVGLTQNLPGLYSAIGGPKPEHTANALLGNFSTKIFHANSCHQTNQWAADTIGKGIRLRWSGGASSGLNYGESVGSNSGYSSDGKGNVSHSGGSNRGRNAGWNVGQNVGYSEQVDYLVQPGEFTRLAKGGKPYRRRVEGVVFQNGKVFEASNRTFLPVIFRQT